jgi:hypothetical protein
MVLFIAAIHKPCTLVLDYVLDIFLLYLHAVGYLREDSGIPLSEYKLTATSLREELPKGRSPDGKFFNACIEQAMT